MFSDAEFTNKKKQTRRDWLLAEIEAVTLQPALVAALLPYYPKGGGRGTIVDATLIAAPPSPKNRDEKRGPEMHQSKKRKNWFFGMRTHIGVDAESGLAHTLVTSAGNVSNVT